MLLEPWSLSSYSRVMTANQIATRKDATAIWTYVEDRASTALFARAVARAIIS